MYRFVWECYKGLWPKGKVIDHINNQNYNYRVYNLQLVTQEENCKKPAKKIDYTFANHNYENKKFVKAINLNKKDVSYFNSMYSIKQYWE